MAEVKEHKLPQGLTGLLDPSSAEVAYIQGMARAGVPAGLLQAGLNDAQSAREGWVRELFGANTDLQDRTSALNQSILAEDRYKTNLGELMKISSAENPSNSSAGLIPLLGIEGVAEKVRNLIGQNAINAGDRRVQGDAAERFQKVGAGVNSLRQGGYTPEWKGVNFDTLIGSPLNETYPTDVERQLAENEGRADVATKPSATVQTDPSGNEIGTNYRASNPDDAFRMAQRGKQILTNPGVGIETPSADGSAPSTPAAPPGVSVPPAKVISSHEQQSNVAAIAEGKAGERVSYGTVSAPPNIVEQLRIIDGGQYSFIKGAKPDPTKRGWAMTSDGYVRDFIRPNGRRVRMKVQPLPGGGEVVIPTEYAR